MEGLLLVLVLGRRWRGRARWSSPRGEDDEVLGTAPDHSAARRSSSSCDVAVVVHVAALLRRAPGWTAWPPAAPASRPGWPGPPPPRGRGPCPGSPGCRAAPRSGAISPVSFSSSLRQPRPLLGAHLLLLDRRRRSRRRPTEIPPRPLGRRAEAHRLDARQERSSGACSASSPPTSGPPRRDGGRASPSGASPSSARMARTRVTTWISASMPASTAASSHACSRRRIGRQEDRLRVDRPRGPAAAATAPR